MFLDLEEMFVHDLCAMEQLDEIRVRIKKLQTAAKSRAELSAMMGYVTCRMFHLSVFLNNFTL